MDVLKYIPVLLVVSLSGADTGGHGGSHHDHVKVHVPEFIHHDHHTKVITIHHHHHKPKEKHHHHHHHHHHQPHVPYGHHYHKQHKKSHSKTLTSTSAHGPLKIHHGHSQGPKKYGNHGHSHQSKPKHTFSYDPTPVSFEDDYKPPVYSAPTIPQSPQVYGVQHTVKQVKVFDTLPGAIPGNAGSHGYEVTEDENSDDDAFTSINSLPQTYPATFGYVRNGVDPAQNEVLVDFPAHNSFQTNHDPFSASQPTSYANEFSGHDPFSTPNQDVSSGVLSSQFSANDATGFDDPANMYSGDIAGTALASDDGFNDDTPVLFSREAGIQETVNTGGVETVVY